MSLRERLFGSRESKSKEEKRDHDTTMEVTRSFTEYRVTLVDEGVSTTEHFTDVERDGDVLLGYEETPRLRSKKYQFDSYSTPILGLDQGESTYFHLSNYDRTKVEEADEYVWVVELDVTKKQKRKGDRDWETYYLSFDIPDEYEVTTWYKDEWEAEKGTGSSSNTKTK